MKNGQLWLFKPIKQEITISGSTFLGYPRDVVLDIDGIINIEDNLNDMPSNMKVRVITSATYRENFEVNTIVFHQDTDTWWVIKTDTSTYLPTNEYEHELELEELLEYFSYRHLPNCAFAPNRYTLEQMLERLFYIGRVPEVSLDFPNFLDKDKQMPFLSFENYTIANALRTIGRVIDGIPRLSIDVQTNGSQVYYREQDIELTYLNRAGLDAPIEDVLDTQFPTQYERNLATKDQYLTRSVSNIQNAKSSNLVIAPLRGGFNNFVPNDIKFDSDNRLQAKVFLPSRIDSIEYVNVYIPYVLQYTDVTTTITALFTGYVNDRQTIIDLIDSIGDLTSGEKALAKDNLPNIDDFYRVRYNDPVDKTFVPAFNTTTNIGDGSTVYTNKMTLLNKFEFDTEDDQDRKDRAIHWLPNTNELIMPLSLRNSLGGIQDHNTTIVLFDDASSPRRLILDSARLPVFNENILVQVGYYPISNIKVTIDNDDDAQNEKYFNQNGKLVDSVSTTQMITAHTRDSSASTKIRNARYDDFTEILPLGQLVRDDNQIYVISQRSLDCQIADGNEYYNVLYTLTRNRTSRSENILADGTVINYAIPDNNIVNRSQLYKDYIELSLTNGNKDTPYLPLNKALVLEQNFAGNRFDFTVLAKNDFGSTPTTIRYVRNGSTFDLYKAKLFNVDWQENNVLGFRFERAAGVFTNTLVQTPVLYTDNLGGATNFELLFLDTEDVSNATDDFNTPSVIDELAPFTDLTRVDEDYYNDSVITEGNFTMRIQEPDYDKDPFEIPVFEYMIQANDDYDPKGNVIVGSDLFTEFVGEPIVTYHYVISSTRFTAENADKIFNANTPSSSTDRRVVIDRTSDTQINLTLFSTLTSVTPPITLNATEFDHIGIYAYDVNANKFKFLFAINDYTMASTSAITLYINNWRI